MEFPFGGPFRRAHSIEEMLNEMSGFISYIEDLNRTDKESASGRSLIPNSSGSSNRYICYYHYGKNHALLRIVECIGLLEG